MYDNTPEELLARAFAFAAEINIGLMRLDGTPYIYHLVEVANIVKECGYGINYQIAALFHDAIENPKVSLDEISVFGDDVVKAVSILGKHEDEEEVYVNAIKKNEIATVVKSAVMISELHEFLYLGTVGKERSKDDLKLARQYLSNAYKYYFCKISNTLDEVINRVEFELYNNKVPTKRQYIYDVSSLRSKASLHGYSFRKNIGQDTYNKSQNHPEFEWDEFSFFRVENYGNEYMAIRDYSRKKSHADDVWWLRNEGWCKIQHGFTMSIRVAVDYSITEISKSEMKRIIRTRISENYFFDFVNTKELIT